MSRGDGRGLALRARGAARSRSVCGKCWCGRHQLEISPSRGRRECRSGRTTPPTCVAVPEHRASWQKRAPCNSNCQSRIPEATDRAVRDRRRSPLAATVTPIHSRPSRSVCGKCWGGLGRGDQQFPRTEPESAAWGAAAWVADARTAQCSSASDRFSHPSSVTRMSSSMRTPRPWRWRGAWAWSGGM